MNRNLKKEVEVRMELMKTRRKLEFSECNVIEKAVINAFKITNENTVIYFITDKNECVWGYKVGYIKSIITIYGYAEGVRQLIVFLSIQLDYLNIREQRIVKTNYGVAEFEQITEIIDLLINKEIA